MVNVFFCSWCQRRYEHLTILQNQYAPQQIKIGFKPLNGPVYVNLRIKGLRVDLKDNVLRLENKEVRLLLYSAADNRALELFAKLHNGALLLIGHVDGDVPVLIDRATMLVKLF